MKNGRGKTPLIVAMDLIQLMEAEAEPACNYGCRTLPNIDTRTVELLIKHGVDVNITDNEGNTPLYRSVTLSSADVTRLLLRAGWIVNIWNNKGQTPLMLAAMNGSTTMLQMLANAPPLDCVNDQDCSGNTALHYGTKHDVQDPIHWLVIHKADLSISSHDCETPFLLAVRWGCSNVVGYLVGFTKVDDDSWSRALNFAVRGNSKAIFVCILEECSTRNRLDLALSMIEEAEATTKLLETVDCSLLLLYEDGDENKLLHLLSIRGTTNSVQF